MVLAYLRGHLPYLFSDSKESCVYAAGVSNSNCSDQREFDRERDRLMIAMEQHRLVDLFLYFGTCSADGSLDSPYVQHKIKMEKIVSEHPRYLILRLPQTAGKTENPHTLLNYIFTRIIRSERFQIWKNARRNIIDVDDVVRNCCWPCIRRRGAKRMYKCCKFFRLFDARCSWLK